MKKKVTFERNYSSSDAYVKRFDESEISFPIHPVFKVIGVIIILFLVINPFSSKFFGFWNMRYVNSSYSSSLGDDKGQIKEKFGSPLAENENNFIYENSVFSFNEKGKCLEISAPAQEVFKTKEQPTVKNLQYLFKSAGKVTDLSDGSRITEYNFIFFRTALCWTDPLVSPKVLLYK